MPAVNINELSTNIINALIPSLIQGSNTLVSYQRTFAKILAEFVADVNEKNQNHSITKAETINLLKMWETMVSVSIAAEDVIETSTRAKVANAVLKVLQDAINAVTGFAIKLF
jgi:hypothetical protein